MMNIQTALRQMRIARKLGRISNEVQTRTLRRLGVNHMAHWEAMMRMRAGIEKKIAPVLHARRVAEREAYDIKFAVASETRKPQLSPVSAKVARKPLVGYEYTPAWWKEAELRERAARKAARSANRELVEA